MPGRTHGGHITPGRVKVYEALKSKLGKKSAARIANAGKTSSGRKAMARKAQRNRRG